MLDPVLYPQVLVLRLRRVPFIDMTGLLTLEEVIGKLDQRGITVLICEANDRVRGKLDKAGILATVGSDNYLDSFAAAIARADMLIGSSEAAAREHQRVLSAHAQAVLKVSQEQWLDRQP